MTTTVTQEESPTVLSHRQWMSLAAEEYRRLDDVLGSLTAHEWAAPTDCDGWTVRDIVAHLIGAAEAGARTREQLRQQRIGGKAKGDRLQIDAVNDLQIRERAGLTPTELRAALADAGARGIRGRTRMPAPVRALRFRFPPPVGWATLGFLNDAVYTRDAWMHRVDICRATGAHLELTADHDGAIVADAVRAWRDATGAAAVVLTGAAGSGCTGEATETSYDAIEFARALSGRGKLPGIPGDVVLF